jgi:hypothetical protein
MEAMHKNYVPLILSVRPCADALRFHCRVSAVLIAVLLIAIIVVTVAAVLPAVLSANHQSHNRTLRDLDQVAMNDYQ